VTRIRWTTEAANHLEDIVRHIQQNNPDAARKTAQAILDRVGELQVFLNLGWMGQEVEGMRELVFPPYVIVYRLKNDVAEVPYIWDGAQDWR
jgi:plasmid stabilization system protein ParE